MDVRKLRGLVCPLCRHHDAGATGRPLELTRCPRDGRALVAPRVLADADGDPLLGATAGGRYVILGKIGVGSRATVYRARDEATGLDVALKVFRSGRVREGRGRVEREARVLGMLRSPHTVALRGSGVISWRGEDALLAPSTASFLAMEMLEGEPLGARLRRAGRLEVRDAIRFAKHALASLVEAHERGIVHRDVKPDNVFLARAGARPSGETGKLLDFGLALITAEASVEGPSGIVGTPRYMSPEQARGEVIDARSNLYAVGVVLYQMLVGRPPFTDASAARVMARHASEPPVPPREAAPDAGIPLELADLVERALAKRASDRPESARAFLEGLEALGVRGGERGRG